MADLIKKLFEAGWEWLDFRTGINALIKDQLTEYRIPPKLNFW